MNYANGEFIQNPGLGAGTGYNYNPNRAPQPEQRKNVLTQEEIQKLIKKDNGLSLQLTETDILRAACNHRTLDGTHDTLREDDNGMISCEICQYKFLPLDPNTSSNELQECVDKIIDILQTIKLLYINIPDEVSREYFQIIPLLEKIPKLFEFAAKNYTKHSSMNMYNYNNRNMNAINIFNMLAGGGMMGAMPQQQPYGYNSQASNGFGYNYGGYAPQTNGYVYNPNNVDPNVSAQPQTSSAQLPATTDPVTQNFKA